MQISIDDKALAGFNGHAKSALGKAVNEFAEELIKESNRIEAARNPTSGNPQVTSEMVVNAASLVKQGLGQPKKKIGVKLLRIASSVLSLAVGFAYDATRLQDKTYMLIFILIVGAAIVAVTISTIME